MQSISDLFSISSITSHDGLQLSVYDSGGSERPVALLVNAYGMPVELLAPLAAALVGEFRVVTWNCRGMPADTPDRSARWGLSDHCEDIRSVLRQRGIDRATVGIGWCTGARLLLYFAARYPELMARAIPINGAYRFPGLPRTAYQDELEPVLVSLVGNPALADIFCVVMRGVAANPKALEQAPSLTDPTLRALVQAPYVDAEHLERYAALCSRDNERNDFAILPEVRIPVHLVAGEQDRISHPDASSEISKQLRGATYHLVEGCDHYVAYSKPEAIVGVYRAACSR